MLAGSPAAFTFLVEADAAFCADLAGTLTPAFTPVTGAPITLAFAFAFAFPLAPGMLTTLFVVFAGTSTVLFLFSGTGTTVTGLRCIFGSGFIGRSFSGQAFCDPNSFDRGPHDQTSEDPRRQDPRCWSPEHCGPTPAVTRLLPVLPYQRTIR